VLLGRNGVGKTTLLKSLMGLVPIKTGTIEFDGKPISAATPYERARAGIGFVPQGREIFARLTVEENLRMGLAYKPGSTPIPAELFELFPVLKQMLHRAAATCRRAAAAAGHCPRAGRRPQAADPGRTHRRHPAQHHQGHRPRHPHAGRPRRPWPSCCASSTTTLPRNWPTSTW
jgi:ABC-type Fe3+/spermidine/putrescine transport system ATPase subunit